MHQHILFWRARVAVSRALFVFAPKSVVTNVDQTARRGGLLGFSLSKEAPTTTTTARAALL
jgi:hypothetical protein